MPDPDFFPSFAVSLFSGGIPVSLSAFTRPALLVGISSSCARRDLYPALFFRFLLPIPSSLWTSLEGCCSACSHCAGGSSFSPVSLQCKNFPFGFELFRLYVFPLGLPSIFPPLIVLPVSPPFQRYRSPTEATVGHLIDFSLLCCRWPYGPAHTTSLTSYDVAPACP